MLSKSRPVLSAVPTAAHPPRSEAPERIDDGALLSLVLTSGLIRDDATALGLLARFASPGGVLSADECELRRAGASDPVVDRLREVRELVVRAARNEICDRPVVSSWSQLLAYVRTAIAHLPREQFRALYLDRKNVLIVEEWVADGDVDHAPVYPRQVVRRALELCASAIILVHNHPSGDPSPSTADIEMTRKIIDAARVFNIQVYDHLIVGRQGTASFKSLGLM